MHLGKHSPKVVELRKAIRQGTLTEEGLLPIEGPILLDEALRSRIPIVDVFIRSGTPVRPVPSAEIHELPPDIFKSIQDTEHSQGVIATIRPPQLSLAKSLSAAPALAVVLG